MRSLNADISNVDYCGTMHHSVTQKKPKPSRRQKRERKEGRKRENGLRKLKTKKKKKVQN